MSLPKTGHRDPHSFHEQRKMRHAFSLSYFFAEDVIALDFWRGRSQIGPRFDAGMPRNYPHCVGSSLICRRCANGGLPTLNRTADTLEALLS
jgi:hypothetical protein